MQFNSSHFEEIGKDLLWFAVSQMHGKEQEVHEKEEGSLSDMIIKQQVSLSRILLQLPSL